VVERKRLLKGISAREKEIDERKLYYREKEIVEC
jgi:hypothetical protein